MLREIIENAVKEMLTEGPLVADATNRSLGYQIVVCQRGFVYAGDVITDGEDYVVQNAVNIRKWGTTKGLGQLALTGATPTTVVDTCEEVRVHKLAVVHLMRAKERLYATA